MVCAALSSMILGTFMCILIILCRRFRINPGKRYLYFFYLKFKVDPNIFKIIKDNIACPMASSLGDLLTLIILATCGEILLQHLRK
jgi:solute carrier family 41